MNNYSYKVMVESDTCLARRAVAFHDDRFLTFEQMQKPTIRHLTSQTCVRCNENHDENDFVVVEVERGEPDGYGGFYYRAVFPGYPKDSSQLELGL